MEYLDDHAEESENDAESGSDGEPQIKKRKTKGNSKKSKKLPVSSDEDEDDDDDDEEKEEMKDFIASDNDEEDDAKSEKTDENNDDNQELDDDDLDLLNENLDMPQNRQNRVELADSDDEDDQSRIKKNLFGADDDDDDRSERGYDVRKDRQRRYSGDAYSDSERSEDNFIEDDGDGPRRHRKRRRGDERMPEGAEDDARDVFGVEDFNFDEFYDDDEQDDVDDEEEEIVEDDGEGGEVRIRRKKDNSKKTTLMEAIEPSELERGFLSASDKKIMIEDYPERFLLRRTPVTECDEEEMEREARWLLKYAFKENPISNQTQFSNHDKLECLQNGDDSESKENEVIYAIKEVLRFIRVRSNSFEVPFIGFYRKENYDSVLTIPNLWKIYDYDEKWCHLTHRKNRLIELVKRMKNYQENGDDLVVNRKPILEMDIIDLNNVATLEHLTDVHANFQLLYGPFIDNMADWEKNRERNVEDQDFKTRFKSCIKNDKYQVCVDNGIGELAGRFGLTAKQFAENLDWKKNVVVQDDELPLDAAEAYICAYFPDKNDVLEAAKFMLAKEISRQPMVRDKVRRDFRTSAMLTASPTKKGVATIDETHPLFEKRYISNMPVSKLEADEFLYFHQAFEEKLIDLKIRFEGQTDDDMQGNCFMEKILFDKPFSNDEYSHVTEEWNEVRNDCVRIAIVKMLLPYIEQEIYNTLLEESKTAVIKKCANDFAARISHSGFVPHRDGNDYDEDEEEMDRQGKKRIMAICYSTSYDEAAFGVMVDENGVVVDYLRMVHFTKKNFGPGHTAALKTESMNLFKKFVERKLPHAIGLNIEDMECQRLKRDLETAIDELLNSGLINKRIPVFLMDNEFAKVYMRSNTSLSEHPDYPPILRQAVSLARILLDPLPEFAHLWNADGDIFCLSLHPLQRAVDQETLANALNHLMVDKVNEEGCDINKCVEFPHYTNMLQFVSGLGPRKAAFIIKNINQNDGFLESRTKLVMTCKLGPKVFMNCAGFIRIDTQKVSEKTELYVEVLDGSRVHPETYEWARKMAVDALEVDDSADPTTALMEIMETPERLRDLDLDAFADELNRQGYGEKKQTLYDIAAELHVRYKDSRKEFEEPNGELLFDLLCRSGKEIKEGSKILGTVAAVQYKRPDKSSGDLPLPESDANGELHCSYCKQFTNEDPGIIQEHMATDTRNGGCPGMPVGIKVRLDNGMMGFCPNKNISKDRIDNPLKRVKINQPYWFKVISITKEKFSFLLSCKSSDLNNTDNLAQNEYWDHTKYEEDKAKQKRDNAKKTEANTRVKRVINHPNFKNISYEAATKMLDDMDWSECIIRPSAHKDSSLSVTWKISNGIYHNFFVKETAKDQVFSIGRQLTVGDEEFEDLNELIARFVQPMIQVSHEITTHKYFLQDLTCEDTNAIEEQVRIKKHELGRNSYLFSASYKRPCCFYISYTFDNSGRVRHEWLTVDPHGVRFRSQKFQTVDHMLAWFKKHFNERPIDNNRRTGGNAINSQFQSNTSHYYGQQPSHTFAGY